MITLDTFIKEALVQIAKGVREAEDEVHKLDPKCLINPRGVHIKSDTKSYHEVSTEKEVKERGGKDVYNVREVEFDIAITASEETKDTAKGGVGGNIKVLSANLDGTMENLAANTNVSRIKFSLPIGFRGHYLITK